MATDISRILEDALKLPLEARAALIDSLLDSLDTAIDADAEAAWGQEIRRRLAEIDSGQAQLIPWSEARRSILGR